MSMDGVMPGFGLKVNVSPSEGLKKDVKTFCHATWKAIIAKKPAHEADSSDCEEDLEAIWERLGNEKLTILTMMVNEIAYGESPWVGTADKKMRVSPLGYAGSGGEYVALEGSATTLRPSDVGFTKKTWGKLRELMESNITKWQWKDYLTEFSRNRGRISPGAWDHAVNQALDKIGKDDDEERQKSTFQFAPEGSSSVGPPGDALAPIADLKGWVGRQP